MKAISATQFRSDLYNMLNTVKIDHEPLKITHKTLGNAVLISEEDWDSIAETLYLHSISGMVESILDAKDEPIEEGTKMEDVDW